eukprot:SAG22_NODE_2013_length_3140_cov_6.228214_3_plen_58_part_00
MSTAQRNLLGFPRPRDRYWTEQTLAAVQDRYAEMDMADYWRGFHERKARRKIIAARL